MVAARSDLARLAKKREIKKSRTPRVRSTCSVGWDEVGSRLAPVRLRCGSHDETRLSQILDLRYRLLERSDVYARLD